MKRVRKWPMWAAIYPTGKLEVFDTRDEAVAYLERIDSDDQPIIQVEVRELPRRRKRK